MGLTAAALPLIWVAVERTFRSDVDADRNAGGLAAFRL